MSQAQIEAQENKEKELKEIFSESLGRALDFEILGRALNQFLLENSELYDFDAHFNPPVLLSEELFKALVLDLSNYFDGFNLLDFGDHIFMVMSSNNKRLLIVYSHKDINGKIFYAIERVEGKTYKS